MFDFSAKRVRWVVSGIFMATWAVCALAQDLHEFGNRREGTTDVATARPAFTPIALIRNGIDFQTNATLYVRFYIPPLSPNQKIFLTARERQESSNRHYVMEAKSPPWKYGDWNFFGPWPTADVIDKLKIKARNVAVLAEYDKDNGSKVYLPVDIYENKNQLTNHPYTFHFIAGTTLQKLEVRVKNSAGTEVNAHTTSPLQCETTLDVECSWCKSGSAQSFPLDLSGLPQGEYHVHLTGHVHDSFETISWDFTLYHTSVK